MCTESVKCGGECTHKTVKGETDTSNTCLPKTHLGQEKLSNKLIFILNFYQS